MKGFALPVVLFLIGLGGALGAGGAFIARQQASGQRAVARSARVDGVAEEWAARTIASWDSTKAGIVGMSETLEPLQSPGIVAERWITRTDTSVYWVVVEVLIADKPLQRRRLGASLVRSGNVLLFPPGWGWIDLP